MCVYEWDAVLCAVSFMKSFGVITLKKKSFFFFQLFIFSVCGRTFFSVSLFFLLAALFVVVCINIQIIQL